MAQPIHEELSLAIGDLNSRGLQQSARWAAEQLCGLDEEWQQQAASCSSSTQAPATHPRFLLGKSHFEFKEYQRAACVLQGVPGPHAQFLRLYSLFLAGEKLKEQDRIEKAGSLGQANECENPNLEDLDGLLAEARRGSNATDPFLLYLHGVVLLDRKRNQEAEALLISSLHAYPCNWSAWQALKPLCTSVSSLQALRLPNHWTRDFFLASILLDLQQNQEALGRLQRLSHVFPHSAYMETLVAQAHYNLQNYDEAQTLFEDILTKDPFRLEGMDIFSNILFVKEQFASLSQLAHRAMATDKYCPESCFVVGNYYSLKGQHEKAVEYFRRALRLNGSYLAAWTLMGHEYMEMKNTPAAIEAYRRAVDLNPQDFRAWYGLGQAYELLKMPFYAVYYYRRATALRPQDARMWCALGQCYVSEPVHLPEQAIRCYKRAIEYNDPDGIAAHALAKLYEQRQEYGAAEQLYRYNLARLEQAGQPLGADAVEALLFLAARCKDTGRLAEAQACCERLLDIGGAPKERAKALAREVHSLQQQMLHGGVSASQLRQQQLQGVAGPAQWGAGAARDAGPRPTPLQLQRTQPSMRPEEATSPSPSPGPDADLEMEEEDVEARAAVASAAAAAGAVPNLIDIAAVMQQLQIPEERALELLLQADGDPVRAVTENLHHLERPQ